METKLGKRGGHFTRLLVGELNPNPYPDDFRHGKEAWRFTTQ